MLHPSLRPADTQGPSFAVPAVCAATVPPESGSWDRRRDCAQRILKVRALLSLLFAPQQSHRNRAHGIEVGIAKADGAGQHAIAQSLRRSHEPDSGGTVAAQT